jgi:hypothetical protein
LAGVTALGATAGYLLINRTSRPSVVASVPKAVTKVPVQAPVRKDDDALSEARVAPPVPPKRADKPLLAPMSDAKMSVAAWRDLDRALVEQIKHCWTPPDTDNSTTYTPKMRIDFSPDGGLSHSPVILNPGTDPASKAVASSATKAVAQCKSLAVPARFQPYYAEWKTRVVHF